MPAPLPASVHDSELVSIIIPTHNEAAGLPHLLRYLTRAGTETPAGFEIIVADGQSTDATAALARQAGARVLACPVRGRAAQLNYGARHAAGGILYFLHADTYPPQHFLADIRRAVAEGYGCGCYRLAFDQPHWFLRLNAWFSRFNVSAVRYGDQSLFVTRPVFEQVAGYRETLVLMEDQDLARRLRQLARFRVLPTYVTTSARKYRENGVFRLQGTFYLITILYWLGAPQGWLLRVYRGFIRSGGGSTA